MLSQDWKDAAQLALDTYTLTEQYTSLWPDGRTAARGVSMKADHNLSAVIYAVDVVNRATMGPDNVLIVVRWPWRTMYEMHDPRNQLLHPGYVVDKWANSRFALADINPGELYLVMAGIAYLTGCSYVEPGVL